MHVLFYSSINIYLLKYYNSTSVMFHLVTSYKQNNSRMYKSKFSVPPDETDLKLLELLLMEDGNSYVSDKYNRTQTGLIYTHQ